MQFVRDLETKLAIETSYFRAALLREDLARLERLRALAASAPSREAFLKDALMSGWSANDMRTHELRPALDPLLEALYAVLRDPQSPRAAELPELWAAFDQLRMDRLVGCLSRVPQAD